MRATDNIKHRFSIPQKRQFEITISSQCSDRPSQQIDTFVYKQRINVPRKLRSKYHTFGSANQQPNIDSAGVTKNLPYLNLICATINPHDQEFSHAWPRYTANHIVATPT